MKKVKGQEILSGLDQPQKTLLSHYCVNLRADRDENNFDKRVLEVLLEYAKDKSYIKWVKEELDSIDFTQSSYRYSQIEDALSKFEEENHPSFRWNKNYQTAKELLESEFKEFRLNVLKYRSDAEMEQSLPKKSTHAGFSRVLTGKKTKGEYIEGILNSHREFERQALVEGSFNRLILIGSRTQASGFWSEEKGFNPDFKKKSRLVSMVDVMQIFSELRFAKPLQNKLGYLDWYAGGKDDNTIRDRLMAWRGRYPHWYSIDYSSYDQTISHWLIYDSFDIIKKGFRNISPEYDAIFDLMVHDFVEKCFIDADGRVRYSRKGVPSGSMFTQIIDSIVNRLMITTYMLSKFQGSRYQMMIMGDDNIIFSTKLIDLHDMESYLRKNFGIVMNAEKCKLGGMNDNPEFLSRAWTGDGGDRPNVEVIAKALFPERKRPYYNGEADPYLVVYSYILAYPVALRRIFNVPQFLVDHSNLKDKAIKTGWKYLSGYLAYREGYLRQRE